VFEQRQQADGYSDSVGEDVDEREG
jgi:hypothetical protein